MIWQDVPDDDRGARGREPGCSGTDADKSPRVPPPVPVSYTYDGSGRSGYSYYAYSPAPEPFQFELIVAKGVFAVTSPDGKVEHFRDKPVLCSNRVVG